MTGATWKQHPPSSKFNTGSNWVGETVPDGIATFGPSRATHLSLPANTTIGEWNFKTNAPANGFKVVNDGHGGPRSWLLS